MCMKNQKLMPSSGQCHAWFMVFMSALLTVRALVVIHGNEVQSGLTDLSPDLLGDSRLHRTNKKASKQRKRDAATVETIPAPTREPRGKNSTKEQAFIPTLALFPSCRK